MPDARSAVVGPLGAPPRVGRANWGTAWTFEGWATSGSTSPTSTPVGRGPGVRRLGAARRHRAGDLHCRTRRGWLQHRSGLDSPVRPGSGSGLISTIDPGGFTVEFFHGVVHDHEPFVSPTGVSGFATGDQGTGHIVLATPDIDASTHFYTNVLGFESRRTNGRDHGGAFGDSSSTAGDYHGLGRLREDPAGPRGCVGRTRRAAR